MTPLATALAAMNAAPEDETARLLFYEALADAEVYLALEAEPSDESIDPRMAETVEGSFALAHER